MRTNSELRAINPDNAARIELRADGRLIIGADIRNQAEFSALLNRLRQNAIAANWKFR